MAKDKRYGRQTPTTSVIMPYEHTWVNEAVELYERSGRTAMEWQKLLLSDLLAYNDEELFVHAKYGFSVPRRNGKNEVIIMRELWGLWKGERICHTAHRTSTSHLAWDRLLDAVEAAGLPVAGSYRASGKEHIEITGGGKIEFRTRTSKGGLGEGFDLLVIDEAQEYQDDQESALKYVVSDSMNPQTIFTGTPPTPVSSGVVFKDYRDKVLQGMTEDCGWAEWGIEEKVDPYDVDAWYETNPSMGTVLNERKVKAEIGKDVDDFNIQRLGLWVRFNLQSAISQREWEELQLQKLPEFAGKKLFFGIKYNPDGASVSMSLATQTKDDKIFVEGLDTRSIREGNGWMLDYLKRCGSNVGGVVVDGASGQSVLIKDMDNYGLKPPTEPKVAEVIDAYASFESSVFAKTICHMGQPGLTRVASTCEHRAIGGHGGFGYKSLSEDIDISLLDSTVLAFWLADKTPAEAKKQRIIY